MITVQVTGLEELRAKLAGLEAGLDVVEILDEAEALMLNRIRSRFLSEVDPDDNPWIPSRRALRTGGKTLFKTGTLFHSIQAYAVDENTRTISSDVPYGKYHQYGVGRMHRPFMGVNDKDLYLVERLIIKRVEEALS